MALYQSGNTITIHNGPQEKIDSVPPGFWIVHPEGVMAPSYLEKQIAFHLPPKIYGKTPRHSARILQTLTERTHENTGILLTGNKGDGKSLLLHLIANRCVEELNTAVFIVKESIKSSTIEQWINAAERRCVILIDEFEKLYKDDDQKGFLTLMSENRQTGTIFLCAANRTHLLNDFLINRTERFYYRIPYKGIDQNTIEEYARDHLKNAEHIPSLVKVNEGFSALSFDNLKSLIEEMNRFNDNAINAMEMMNINPDIPSGKGSIIQTKIIYKNQDISHHFTNMEDKIDDLKEERIQYEFLTLYPKFEDRASFLKDFPDLECYADPEDEKYLEIKLNEDEFESNRDHTLYRSKIHNFVVSLHTKDALDNFKKYVKGV